MAALTHDEIFTKWRLKAKPTLHVRGEFKRYSTGLWRTCSDDLIRREILKIAVAEKKKGTKPNAGLLNSVMLITRTVLSRNEKQFDRHPFLLRCKNGTLELEKRNLRDHSPEDYLTSGVNFDYDPVAPAVAWLSYCDHLSMSLGPEVVSFLQEFAGLCITTEMKYELALWLYGPPGCGKSTFIEGVLVALRDRSCTLGLSSIERSQFALSDIPGRTIAFATEQPSRAVQSAHVLNALISGERLLIERKYRDPQEITPTCKLIWAMNSLPVVQDANSGLFRRTCVVEFPPLKEADRNPNLKQAFKQEGAGILNWCLDGLERLQKRDRFLVPESVKRAREAYQLDNDLVALWQKDRCEVAERCREKSYILFENFQEWLEQNGERKVTHKTFSKDLTRLGFVSKRKTAGIVVFGIGLKSDDVGM